MMSSLDFSWVKFRKKIWQTICIGVFPTPRSGDAWPSFLGSLNLRPDRGRIGRRSARRVTDSFVAVAAAAAGRPLDVFINMNINDISSISEMRMVSKPLSYPLTNTAFLWRDAANINLHSFAQRIKQYKKNSSRQVSCNDTIKNCTNNTDVKIKKNTHTQ